MKREFTVRRSTVGAFVPSFLLSLFELFETRGRKSTSLTLSWFHLLLRILLLHLSPSLWLPAFRPSFLSTSSGPYHPQGSLSLRPSAPSPTLFFAFADVFSRSEEKKSPQKTSIFLPSFNFAINEIPHEEEHLLPESLNFEFSASLPPTKINVIF